MFKIPTELRLSFTSSQGALISLHSPNEGELLSQIQYATAEDVNVLLTQLPVAQKSIATLPAYKRAEFLKQTAELIRQQSEDLAQLIAAEGGKPFKDARVEVTRAAQTFDLCAEETTRMSGEVIPMERTAAGVGHLNFTLRDPIGPVLAISAFNHPLNLLAHQVGPALAAGNAVVIKPAPSTPLSAYALLTLLQQAGAPKESLSLINCDIPEIQKLVSAEEISFVSFIGSAKVGWEIRKQLAPGTRLSLEHGGQAPAILRQDADLDLAIPQLIKSSFYHSGQVCISTQRIFLPDSLEEKFLKAFSDEVKKLKVGSALKEDTDLGPLIRPQEVVRIQKWIQEALDAGAELLMGNQVSGNNKQYLSPTILRNVPRDCQIMKEEVFGPVVCVNTYRDEEELRDYLNTNPYIFEACLYTQDLTQALSWARKLSTMTLVINNHSAYRVDWMPFGGHGKAGLGMGGVRYAMEEMTRLKQIIIKG